jgi:hypothetical protein
MTFQEIKLRAQEEAENARRAVLEQKEDSRKAIKVYINALAEFKKRGAPLDAAAVLDFMLEKHEALVLECDAALKKITERMQDFSLQLAELEG